MSISLQNKLKQQSFRSPYQEAMLELIVVSDRLTRRMEDTCIAFGITAAQYNVLRILRGVHPNGHPRCEIISRMLKVAPDVTRLIDRLEKMGFAERGKGSDDRRHSITRITKSGLALLDKMQPTMDAFDALLQEHLSSTDARKLCSLLEKVSQSVEVTQE